jgi:hypothetical protein
MVMSPFHPLAAARVPAGHQQAEGGVRTTDDPRHVFLSASEVMARYGSPGRGALEDHGAALRREDDIGTGLDRAQPKVRASLGGSSV